LNSIQRGKISSIQSFGVFVKMKGFKKSGMVHVSQLTKTRVKSKEDIEGSKPNANKFTLYSNKK